MISTIPPIHSLTPQRTGPHPGSMAREVTGAFAVRPDSADTCGDYRTHAAPWLDPHP